MVPVKLAQVHQTNSKDVLLAQVRVVLDAYQGQIPIRQYPVPMDISHTRDRFFII